MKQSRTEYIIELPGGINSIASQLFNIYRCIARVKQVNRSRGKRIRTKEDKDNEFFVMKYKDEQVIKDV